MSSVVGCAQSLPVDPVIARISVGARAIRPVVGADAVWVADAGAGTVSRIGPATNRVVASVRVGDPATLLAQGCAPSSEHAYATGSFGLRACDVPSAVSTGASLLWATKNDADAVVAIDPRTNMVVATVPVGGNPWSLLAVGDSVWISDYDHDRVVRIDARTQQQTAVIADLAHGPTEFAASADSVWVVNSRAGAVTRIDMRTNQVRAVVPLGPWPLGIAVDGDDIWVRGGSTRTDGALALIDARTDAVVGTVAAGAPMGREGVSSLAAVPGAVWVPGVTLDRVDRSSLQVTR